MVRHGLSEGDTLLVYSLRNLGGSPVADKKWQKIIEDVGAQIEIVPEERAPKPMGRPRHHKDIPAENLARIEEIWRDSLLSERDRIQQCSAIAGRPLTRGWLHGRFPRSADKK